VSTFDQKASTESPWYASPTTLGALAGTMAFPFLGLGGTALGALGGSYLGGLSDEAKPVMAQSGLARAAEEMTAGLAPVAAGPARPGVHDIRGVLGEAAASSAVDRSYGNGPLGYKNEALGDLGKMGKEERLALLAKLTQNGGKDSESFCGPTALIAAAIYGGGDEGLNKLIGQLQKGAGKEDQKALEALVERSKNGELDLKAIHDLEGMLFKDLQKRQVDFLMQGGSDKGDAARRKAELMARQNGTSNESMTKFINEAGLGKFFFDERGEQVLDINAIDNNGARDGGNHWVLNINTGDAKDGDVFQGYGGKANAVFDPWKRQGGVGQVVSSGNAGELELLKAYVSMSQSSVRGIENR
jgi:hypothetical protein